MPQEPKGQRYKSTSATMWTDVKRGMKKNARKGAETAKSGFSPDYLC